MDTEQIISWFRDKLAYAPDHSWKRMMQAAIDAMTRLKKELAQARAERGTAEVVRGRWIELPSMAPEYECSECGQTYEWWEPSEAHYCPNCGADMRGAENEN